MQFFRVNGKKIGKRESIWGKVEIIALPIQQPYIWFWKSPPLICQFKVIELPFSAPLPFCSLPPSSPSPSPPLPPARSRRLPSSMASSTLSRWLRPEVCALSVPLYFYYSLSVVWILPPPFACRWTYRWYRLLFMRSGFPSARSGRYCGGDLRLPACPQHLHQPGSEVFPWFHLNKDLDLSFFFKFILL